MRSSKILAVLLVCLLAVATMAAQEVTGTIAGTVHDASGAVVPNATVSVTNTDRNAVIRTVQTDSAGNYLAPLLPIGHYAITVEAGGFKKSSRTGIEVNVNDRLTQNFDLQVGGAGETVNVEANPVQVELQTATAAGLISGTEIRELSLNNRNYEQLVSLMPGVSSGASDQLYIGTTNPSGQANTVSFSINGARNSSNNWTVDGADNVDRGSNLTLLNYPSVDAIAEFKVLRGLYNAEFGRGAGQINVITRSGSSALHGNAYEFVRNDAFAANDYFRKRSTNTFTKNHPAPLRYNNFGYTVGGPVYIPGVYEQKDKTFFFFSQEYRRVITYPTFNTFMPTAAEKQGVFPVPVCVAGTYSATGAFTCSQVLAPGQTIPSNLINPIANAYLSSIWSLAPNPDNPATNATIMNARNVYNHRQELVRLDHTFSTKLQVFGRYLHDTIPTEEPFGLFGPNTFVPGVANSKTDSPGKSWVFRGTYSLTPNLLLDGGYNYSYGAIISRNYGQISSELNKAVPTAVGTSLPYAPTLKRIPSITSASTAYGFSAISGFGPYDDFNRDHNIFASASWVKGKHNLKWGISYHNYSKTENAGGNNAGTYQFSNVGVQATAPGFTAAQMNNAQWWANFLTGNVASFSQVSADITPYIRMHQYEVFGQDEFRLTPRLTVSLGLRYSYFPQPFNDNAQVLSNFDPRAYDPAQAPPINATNGNYVANSTNTGPVSGNILNGIIYANGSLKNSPYGNNVGETSKLNFAPRLGVAWDPIGNGKTSIRAGYGMFHQATLVGIYEQAMFANPPYGITLSLPNVNMSAPQGNAPAAIVPKALRGVQTQGDTPRTQQWSLDVQHELGWGVIADVGYYGSKDSHLIGIVDLNQPQPGAYVTAGISATPLTSSNSARLNAIRPYLGYGPINTIRPWFSSNYNSLQTSVEKRFRGSSLIKANYTWAHALTNSQTDRSSAPQNTYCIHCEYGSSALDRRHVFTASYVYQLPFMKDQKGFLGHIVGGWETSGIVNVMSGLPLTVTGNNATDPAGQGCLLAATTCSVRPNMITNPNAGAPNTLLNFFNTAAFVQNTTVGTIGNAPRGAVLGPGLWRVDMSLFKQIRLTERMGMQLRFETFNVFNHENFNTVNTTFASSQFGQVTASRDPRLIQLGAKFNF